MLLDSFHDFSELVSGLDKSFQSSFLSDEFSTHRSSISSAKPRPEELHFSEGVLTSGSQNYQLRYSIDSSLKELNKAQLSEHIERMERFRLIFDRLAEKVTVEGNTIRVSLEPDGMGRVEISLSTQKGLINGHINVQDPLSKEVIARNIQTLSEMLQKEGINIGNLTVDLNEKNRYKDREDLRDQQVSRINMTPLRGVPCEDCSSNFTFAAKQNRPASGLINLFA